MGKVPSEVKLGLNNNGSRRGKEECQDAMEQNANLYPNLLILEGIT